MRRAIECHDWRALLLALLTLTLTLTLIVLVTVPCTYKGPMSDVKTSLFHASCLLCLGN